MEEAAIPGDFAGKNWFIAMSWNDSASPSAVSPVVERRRMEPVRRNLTVRDKQHLSPNMLRVTLAGEELAGFDSPSPDDHIKVFFPVGEGGTEARDYTPRRFDVEELTLAIDFFLHEGGAGAAWAQQAAAGDPIQIGGPRGSVLLSAPEAWWLLIGDETALPSIGRRLEEMMPGTQAISIVAVGGPEEEQEFATSAKLISHWIYRPDERAGDPAPLLELLAKLEVPPGPGFIWIAAEAEVSRAIREYAIVTLGHPADWIKASAYWTRKG